MTRFLGAILVLLVTSVGLAADKKPTPKATKKVTYEEHIRPIISVDITDCYRRRAERL